MCKECYSNDNCITPLLNPRDCLENHVQYICGTCGRCICIACDDKRHLYRWNFPFKSLEIAKLYLRTADYCNKTNCGIYEIINSKGNKSYKIFPSFDDLTKYLAANRSKTCPEMSPAFQMSGFQEFPDTQIRLLTKDEIEAYMDKRRGEKIY